MEKGRAAVSPVIHPSSRGAALDRAWTQALDQERQNRQRDWLVLTGSVMAGMVLLALLLG
ncbi:MAG: hypothetical protein OEW39_09295 [Deltaproteobacteria bacterium]|nr:hypothetical protein [Deltaproteobacteria bacterium]